MNSYIFANDGLGIPDANLEFAKSVLILLEIEEVECSGSDLFRCSQATCLTIVIKIVSKTHNL